MYIITGNQGKLKEYRAFFPDIQPLELDLAEIQSLNEIEIQEFKITEALKHVSGDFLIDDVSFYADCLPGLPGPFIKWFNQTIKPAGIYDLALKYNTFGAVAICNISYVNPEGSIYHFVGKVQGQLVLSRGDFGFGFDSIFQPDGSDKTYAEMDKAEKNLISHRGLALAKLKSFLDSQ
jgi:inosine triphosphate pyrophosphatase